VTPPSFIGRSFDQICFVVHDLDEAIDYWRRVNGVERWSKAYHLAYGQRDKKYWGEAEDFQFSCAYGFAGTTLIELAEHDGGRSVYKDWLDENGPSMHHIGFRLETADEYETAMQHYRDQGIKEAMSGWFQAPDGNCKWAYVDTRASIGCYTELYYVDGIALIAFEDFRDGRSDEFIPGAPNARMMPKAV
jgi:catechol 2,3-dioxygenase-like lactoylglutathione lyase family enzyme